MQNPLSYENKRAVVVGCFSGMGEATARIVGELGAEIVAVDLKKPSVPHSKYLEVDCRDLQAMDSAVAEIAGAGPIDALFYCAGLPGGSFSNVDVMSVNFLGQRHFAGRPYEVTEGSGGAYEYATNRNKQILVRRRCRPNPDLPQR